MKRAKGKHTVLKIIFGGLTAIVLLIAIFPLIPKGKTPPRVTKIDDHTYNLQEGSTNSCMYLLIGEKEALLIDTGFGFSELDKAVRELTDLPVKVVNTHGHYDHVGSNYLFDDVYMSEKDFELYQYYTTPEAIQWVYDQVPGIFRYFMRQEIIMACDTHPAQVKPLPEEGYFELGSRKVSFFDAPGHTPGSIILYDENSNWLFVGDSGAAGGVLLNLPMSLSTESYLESVETINQFVEAHDITTIYPGHAPIGGSAEIFVKYEQGCRDLIGGNVPEEALKSGSYSIDGVTISFDPNRILKTDE